MDVETPLMIMIQIQKTQHLRVRQQHVHKERNESDSGKECFELPLSGLIYNSYFIIVHSLRSVQLLSLLFLKCLTLLCPF